MWKRWFLGKGSIQTKLLVSYVLLIIVPLGSFNLLSNYFSSKSVEEQVSQNHLKTLMQINEKIEMVMDNIIAISNIYYLNEDVRLALVEPYVSKSFEEAQRLRALNQLYANYTYAFGQLKYRVNIVGRNGFEYHSDDSQPKYEAELWRQTAWYPEAVRKNGSIVWISGPSTEMPLRTKGRHEFSAVRLMKRFETDRELGLLILSIDEKEIQRFYESAEIGQQRIEIVDGQGNIISSRDKTRLFENIKGSAIFEKALTAKSGYYIEEVDQKRTLVTITTVEKTGWIIISYTPLSQLLENMNQLKIIQKLLFVVLIILAVFASYIVARKLAVPIRMLYYDISRVEMGDLSVRSKVKGNDEIGSLAAKFNAMVIRIGDLMSNVIYEQQKKRDAELVALQSQINPHFLYNTLASIRFMLAKHDPEKVDAVIVALVKLLKMTLTRHDEFITVRQEIDILKQYVYIQQARQGAGLEVFFEVEDSMLNCLTIKLLLQPIVENAIFHGIEPKGSQGVLFIRGEQRGTDIVFEISDDGIGFANSMHILNTTSALHGKGIGLRNVHNRIKLYFGEDYGLEVHSEVGVGTTVRIRMPAIYEEEEVRNRYEYINRG